jgi:Fe-S-cluster containining protein
MMNGPDVDFACTECAKCCHGLRLPLTLDEAIDWLTRGASVEILCEAMPWLAEPAPDNGWAAYKRRRSIAATSGELPIRVIVIVAAAFTGPCPNLLPDQRCGIYTERPLVCRIYPAEINPFIAFDARHKACPPDAWASGLPPLIRGGRLVDARSIELIERAREVDVREMAAKAQLCRALGIDRAAIANEGFVAHSPDSRALLDALRVVRQAAPAGGEGVRPDAAADEWRLLSNRRASVDALGAVGAVSEFADGHSAGSFTYLSLSDSIA